MLQRLTDRVNYLNSQANYLNARKAELDKELKKLSEEWEECENKIIKLLPEGVTLLDHFTAEEERRKGHSPDESRTEPLPKSQTPDDPSPESPTDDSPQTPS